MWRQFTAFVLKVTYSSKPLHHRARLTEICGFGVVDTSEYMYVISLILYYSGHFRAIQCTCLKTGP